MSTYGDGGFYFLQPVGSGYSGVEAMLPNRPRFHSGRVGSRYSGVEYGYGASWTARVRLEDEHIGAEAAAKILVYWNKNRIPAYAAEVKRINDNSKGWCAKVQARRVLPRDVSEAQKYCDETRYTNYQRALADYAKATSVANALRLWVSSRKSKYSELPVMLRADTATATWIKANIIDPRYAPTGAFATASTMPSDPCYISVIVNDSLKKLGYPDRVICELAAKSRSSIAGANEVRAIVNNGVPYGGKARRLDALLGANAAALPTVTETATVTGAMSPTTEAVTSMGPQVEATPADQAVAQAQTDLTAAAVATVDTAVAKQEEAQRSGGVMGFIKSDTGKLVLGVATVGAVGYFLLGRKRA